MVETVVCEHSNEAIFTSHFFARVNRGREINVFVLSCTTIQVPCIIKESLSVVQNID